MPDPLWLRSPTQRCPYAHVSLRSGYVGSVSASPGWHGAARRAFQLKRLRRLCLRDSARPDLATYERVASMDVGKQAGGITLVVGR